MPSPNRDQHWHRKCHGILGRVMVSALWEWECALGVPRKWRRRRTKLGTTDTGCRIARSRPLPRSRPVLLCRAGRKIASLLTQAGHPRSNHSVRNSRKSRAWSVRRCRSLPSATHWTATIFSLSGRASCADPSIPLSITPAPQMRTRLAATGRTGPKNLPTGCRQPRWQGTTPPPPNGPINLNSLSKRKLTAGRAGPRATGMANVY